MYQDFFKFPLGIEVELTLSRNRIFDNLILTGKVRHYFRKPGWQTVLQNKEVKYYPVSLVQIELEHGKVTVDVDCILTKPTKEIIDEVDRRAAAEKHAEEVKAGKTKERQPKGKGYVSPVHNVVTTSLRVKIRAAEQAWLYVASKNSKIFHDVDSTMAKRIATENLVKFKDKAKAKASGRTYAGK